MKINDSLKMILVLAAVSLISGAALVFAYQYTRPQITANQKRQLENAIFKVLPGTKEYETIIEGEEKIYVGKDEKGGITGYAVLAKGSGYQGEIEIIAGLDREGGRILAIEIQESVETPGLGGMIQEDDFKSQFKNLSVLPRIDLVKRAPKNPNEIRAITGATISSGAVVKILNDKIEKVRELLGGVNR